MAERPDTPARHRSLVRQLRRLGLSDAAPPGPDAWSALLDQVSLCYADADADRYTLERSLEVSVREMGALHDLLSDQAHRDTLTGLPNRSALLEQLRHPRVADGRSDGAVLFIDLDGFKQVNDALGHAAGDELLVRASERLRATTRARDVVARLGGDEFVVLCGDVGGQDGAEVLAGRICAAVAAPFRVGASDVCVGASIGIALFGGEGGPAGEQALREADLAMYRAKSLGRSQYVVFSPQLRAEHDDQLSLASALRAAVPAGELVLDWAPVVQLTDGALLGREALVRWRRPGLGLLLPEDFLPAAEANHLGGAIDSWVVGEACRQAASWPAGQLVLVELSAADLGPDDLVEVVSRALRRNGLPPGRLMVALAEQALASGPVVAANVDRLRGLGVQIAVSDFGTGRSSVAALRDMPSRLLKLAPGLVRGITEDRTAAAVLGAMIAMSHALGQLVVAPHVERPEQAELLRALGCDAAQGPLFADHGLALPVT